MFCVLKINQRKQNFPEKLFGRFIKDEYKLSTIPVYKGAPFYLLEITIGKREIDWERVLFLVGKCASRLIVNCETDIPDGMNIGLYKSDKLYKKIMENTFLHILKINTDKMKLHTISILDSMGDNSEFVESIAGYSSSLTITTDVKESYYDICESIKENTGLCPVFAKNFVDCDVKINCDKNIMSIIQNTDIMNLSCGLNFEVPDIYENLLPSGVSEYDFYSALYELCGVFELENCIFKTLIVNNEKKRVDDIHFS